MSTPSKVLVPLDFSPASEMAIDYALALGLHQPLQLVLLHVLGQVPDIPPALDFNRAFNVPEYRRLLAESALQRLQALAARLGEVPGQRQIFVAAGDPAEEIARVAAEEQIDLIVMSTHGRRGFDHVLHGSVTEKVVRVAPCPVLCVRPKRAAP